MLTNLKHLALYSLIANLGSLIYISIAFTEKKGNYVTQERGELMDPYFDAMLAINSSFCISLMIYLIYSWSKEHGRDKEFTRESKEEGNIKNKDLPVSRENKLWTIPFFLIAIGYIVGAVVLEQEIRGEKYNDTHLKNEISSKDIVNDIFIVYITVGALQLIFCVLYLFFSRKGAGGLNRAFNRVNPYHHIKYLLANSHPEEIAALAIVIITIIGVIIYLALVIFNKTGTGHIWPGIPYRRPCPKGTTDRIKSVVQKK